MRNNNIKKTLVLMIISIFLLTGLQNVSSLELKTKNGPTPPDEDLLLHVFFLSSIAEMYINFDTDEVDITYIKLITLDVGWDLNAGIRIRGPCSVGVGHIGEYYNILHLENENVEVRITLIWANIYINEETGNGNLRYSPHFGPHPLGGIFGGFNVRIWKI
jgi:hypothetical protein